METCKQCNRPFVQVKPWQEFCCTRCQQDWHLHQRKLARVEEAEDRREAKMNGHGTPAERQKATGEARMVIERMKAEPRIVRRI
jgi:protein-arginine kinase activator protein McsA